MIASISFQVSILVLEATRYFALLAQKLFHEKKSILSSHCASKKHASGKEMIKKSKLREHTSTEPLSREKSHQDRTLLLTERAYRQEVMEEFLKSRIPIGKIYRPRPLLEKMAIDLPVASVSGST